MQVLPRSPRPADAVHGAVRRFAAPALLAAFALACASPPPLHEPARRGDVVELERQHAMGQAIDEVDDAGQTALHQAAREGQLEAVAWLLAAGANVNAFDRQHRTPLWLAVNERRTLVAELLLENGADPNVVDRDRESPLYIASRRAEPQLVAMLLDGGADPDLRERDGRTALFRAADKGSSEIVRMLLAGGASPDIPTRDGETPLLVAVDDGALEIATDLLAAGASPDPVTRNRVTPLMRAVERRDVQMLRVLLAAQADPDVHDGGGTTPLMRAVQNRHAGSVEMLLEAGADPDLRDSNGRTPLGGSVESRSYDLVSVLLVGGANPDLRGPNRLAPILVATRNNDLDMATLLLEHGADPNARDQVGNPPIFVAVIQHQNDMVELLLTHGAHPALRGLNGQTPLELANQIGNPDAAELLREASSQLQTGGERQLARQPGRTGGGVPSAESAAQEGTRIRRESTRRESQTRREAQRQSREAWKDRRDSWEDQRDTWDDQRESWEDAWQDSQDNSPGPYDSPWPEGADVNWTSPSSAAGYGILMAKRAIAEAAENVRRSMDPYAVPPRPPRPAKPSRPGRDSESTDVYEEPTPSTSRPPLDPGEELVIESAARVWRQAEARPQAPLYSRRVAVVVGINEYQHWPALEGAHSDAERVSQAFRDLGFDEVIEIYDTEATRIRLLTALGDELAAKTDGDSLAMIYFAGHGQTETLPNGQKRGYIIPVDGDREQVYATAISMDRLRDLSNRIPAKQVYYAMDSCYSGLGFTRGISLVRKSDGYVRKVTSMRSVQMITAGLEGEQALEIGGRGLFTTYFLRALEGEADFDSDGHVTASEIGTYVRPQVTAASRNRQTPQFGTLEGQGEVVFRLQPAGGMTAAGGSGS